MALSNSYLMISNFLKLAMRNIFNDKIYSLINVIGHAVAVACCFLLIFWIKFELSYEDCHTKAERIYKVLEVEKRADGLYKKEQLKAGTVGKLKETFPQIEASTVVHHEQLSFNFEDGEGIVLDYTEATPEYLDMFSYEFIEGSKASVLQNKGAIVSEEVARKFFGQESAIGKTVNFSRSVRCNIQAVVKIPKNTNLKFDILDPCHEDWGGIQYILLKQNARFSDETRQLMADFLGTMRETDNKLAFMPIKDVHLHSPQELTVNNEWQTFGDLKQIYLFSFVALLVLAIAIINYVNTSTARAMNRMREVGIRKVNGSTQWQLILRFLSEAFILSAVSIVIALAVSKWLFPEFSSLMGNQVNFHIDFNTILIILTVCIIITILSGGYAAFYLSSLNPITVIQGGERHGSGEYMRKILIGFQFFLSVGILISTLMIYRQIQYMFTADTGVDRKNITILDTSLWYDVDEFIQVIKRENPNIIDATIASGAPYNVQWGYRGVSWADSPEDLKEVTFAQIFCDYHFADAFGLQVIDGEFIQPGWGWWQWTDSTSRSCVINETFRELMGVDNPLGIMITYAWGSKGRIIGVVKDFNFKPMKEPITPLILSYNPEASTKVFIKTTGYNKKETLDYIRKKYMEMKPSYSSRPFMYSTAEDDYDSMYKSELRTMKMLSVCSVLSLCLCVMGIFSMVSLMLEKRKKEIAIRRINGAETNDIVSLFIANFAKIIGVACVVALPVSFYILMRWIENYAFRIPLSWWIFVLVPLLVSLITAVLIAIQVFFSARQNPAEVVKSE